MAMDICVRVPIPVSRVRGKYEYFRDDIRSTEDFVELSAMQAEGCGIACRAACAGYVPIGAAIRLPEKRGAIVHCNPPACDLRYGVQRESWIMNTAMRGRTDCQAYKADVTRGVTAESGAVCRH